MRLIPMIVVVASLILGCESTAAAIVVKYVNTIVPPVAGNDSITGTDDSADDQVFASGYRSVGDGGGGYFAKTAGTCTIPYSGTASYNSTNNIVTFTGGVTASGLALGMGVSGSGITTGTTITSIAADLGSMTISVTPSSGGSTINVSGGNGGTVIGDYVGNCFNRVGTSWSAREWEIGRAHV